MCENQDSDPLAPPDSLSTDELPKQTGKETHVRYRDSPVRSPERHIHERTKIPPVPEGEQVPDDTPSPPVKMD